MTFENDILIFDKICIEKVWGKKIENNIIGEIIYFSINKQNSNKIMNGNYYGKTIYDLYNDNSLKDKIFGINFKKYNIFPFLIKKIICNDNLSIQVHPDNEDMLLGKKELWYFIEKPINGKIILGLNKNVSKNELTSILKNEKIINTVNYIDVEKSNLILVKPKTIHSLLGGSDIYEIQQNCDITYRGYDWNRERELQINSFVKNCCKNKIDYNYFIDEKYRDKYFNVNIISFKNKIFLETNSLSCHILLFDTIDNNIQLEINEIKYNLTNSD